LGKTTHVIGFNFGKHDCELEFSRLRKGKGISLTCHAGDDGNERNISILSRCVSSWNLHRGTWDNEPRARLNVNQIVLSSRAGQRTYRTLGKLHGFLQTKFICAARLRGKNEIDGNHTSWLTVDK
jgi:hypothetical protein